MSNPPFSFENRYSEDYESNQKLFSTNTIHSSVEGYPVTVENEGAESRFEYPDTDTERQPTQQFAPNFQQHGSDQYNYWASMKPPEIDHATAAHGEMIDATPPSGQPLNPYHNNAFYFPFLPVNDQVDGTIDDQHHIPGSNVVETPSVTMQEDADMPAPHFSEPHTFDASASSNFNALLDRNFDDCDPLLGPTLNSQTSHEPLPVRVPDDSNPHSLSESVPSSFHDYGPPDRLYPDGVTPNSFNPTPRMILPISSNTSRQSVKEDSIPNDDFVKSNILNDEKERETDKPHLETGFCSNFDHSSAVAGSSIPKDMDASQYSAQCILAAKRSRLDPYSLHRDEYSILRSSLGHLHITTYLNIRNGICRLWLSNPLVYVHPSEALGCAKSSLFFNLAGTAYEWLIRNGRINYGCIDVPKALIPKETVSRKNASHPSTNRRKTIVVIGAGLAGLACAQQLTNLSKHYSEGFASDEDVPQVIVVEGRRRVGGRIYSLPLKNSHDKRVDVGASILSGMEFGNPLSVIVRRQLGLPVKVINKAVKLFDEKSDRFLSQREEQSAQHLFSTLLEATGISNASTSPTKNVGLNVFNTESPRKDLQPANQQPDHQLLHASESEDMDSTKAKLVKVGLQPREGRGSEQISSESTQTAHPNLGAALDKKLHKLKELVSVSPEVESALSWHAANLEAATGSRLHSLCQNNWDLEDETDLGTCHCEVVNGLSSLVKGLLLAPDRVDVQLGNAVKLVEYGSEGVRIDLENGECISADQTVVTIPLGVLKSKSVQFSPPLPPWKEESIRKMGFGVINKVIMIFNIPFWEDSVDSFGVCRDQSGLGFLNETTESIRGRLYVFTDYSIVVGAPCLVGFLSGKSAEDVSNEDDSDILKEAHELLCKTFRNKEVPQPIETIVTRWQRDPFARGTFSYVGVEGNVEDYDTLAKPIQNTLFFAGEATNREYPSSAQGAYLSGLRAANEVVTSLIGPITVPSSLVSAASQTGKTIIKPKMNTSISKAQRTGATATKTSTKLGIESLSKRDAFETAVLSEFGPRPEKPSKSSTNPFLIFQKDFWEKCRHQCDDEKRRATGNEEIRAGRNEVRAALGKMWRELPEIEKRPYMLITSNNRAVNDKNIKEFKDRLEMYDLKVQQFKQLWLQQQQHQQQQE